MAASPRIILIDDNRAWLEALSEFLRTNGLEVLTATDVAQALCLLDIADAELVVCDYNLPTMNGLQLVRLLHERQPQAAVLMVSSEDDPSLRRRALAAGACDLLAKTTPPGILLRNVRQLLERLGADSMPKIWQRLLPSPKGKGNGRPRRRVAVQCAAQAHQKD